MGYKYEVQGYIWDGTHASWQPLYGGNRAISALWNLFKYRKKYGCVQLNLRR